MKMNGLLMLWLVQKLAARAAGALSVGQGGAISSLPLHFVYCKQLYLQLLNGLIALLTMFTLALLHIYI
jgi:hypothetical protein